MPTGYLIVQVFADNEANPVEGAEVEIIGANLDLKVLTNSDGKTGKISLSAPSKEYSLVPQDEVKPYAEYSLKVSKPALETSITEGVQIFDGETSIQNVFLKAVEGNLKTVEYSDLPPHVLWGDYPPKITENEGNLSNNNEDNARVLPSVVIPEYIIVHDGIPSNSSANNYIVSFPNYIKNVASSEIYSTWPKETIKANIIAIISFTLNRIYTEWYTSKGYPFTITSSTAYDQKYTHGRTIFESISNITDEIFNQYLRRGNNKNPFFAQYSDGIKVNKAGWLSQWGSKTLGDQGYDALRILRHYYSSDMQLSTADDVEGLPLSFPGKNLKLEDCGEYVQKMQNELNVINGSYPAISLITPADGNFGEKTQNSVKKFQQVFNLPATGIIDFATWYQISYIYVAVTKMLQGIYA